VKTTSNLLGWLFKGSAGQSKTEEGDSVLTVPSLLVPAAAIPFPATHVFENVLSLAPNTGSVIYQREDGMATGLTQVVLELSPGVWDIDYMAMTSRFGAVEDLTANMRVECLVFLGPFNTVTSLLSNLNANNTQPQIVNRQFRLTVVKDIRFQIRLVNQSGLGTATPRHFLSMICSKLF
jgi:hypothetical protein